jgi:hypothetical protein
MDQPTVNGISEAANPIRDREQHLGTLGRQRSGAPYDGGVPGILCIAVAAWVLSLLLLVLAGNTIADLDMFHEMALIRESLTAGHLLLEDVHAFTPTVSPVVHHEWGTGAVLYLLMAAGTGGPGIIMLRLLLFAVVVGACWWCISRKRAPAAVVLALAPVAVVLTGPGTSAVRAHLFTFAFTAVLLGLLEKDRHGNRTWIALWLPIHVLWLNLHGGFVVGMGLFGLHAAEQVVLAWRAGRTMRAALAANRHLVLGLVAMIVLLLVSPYGWRYVPYLWHALRLDRPLIAEWAPVWDPAVQWEYTLVFAVSLLFLVYSLIRAERAATLPGLPLVLAAAWMAAGSQRLLPVYGILWITHVPSYIAGTDLHRLLAMLVRTRAMPIAAVAFVLTLLAMGRSVQLRFWELQVPGSDTDKALSYPVGPAEYLAHQAFRGNLVTTFNAGAFISWKLYPAVRVSIDSRYEVAYPAKAVEESVTLYAARDGWQDILSRYQADALLVPMRAPLHDVLLADRTPDWRRVYVDDGFAVFVPAAAAPGFPIKDRRGEHIMGSFP